MRARLDGACRVLGRCRPRPDIAALALLLALSSCCVSVQGAFGDVGTEALPIDKDASDLVLNAAKNFSIGEKLELEEEEDNMLFIDLNKMVVATYEGSLLTRTPLETQFYITQLPEIGQLFQAYRSTSSCADTFPLSCITCCEGKTFTDPDPTFGITCCAKLSDFGKMLFGVGSEITSVPSKVLVPESGFLWYRPPAGILNTTVLTIATQMQFEVEMWQKERPQVTAASASDSGCAADRVLCAADAVANARACGTCSARTASWNVTLGIVRRRHYPQVGFGGQMLSFDGGDDYLVAPFKKMAQYEFSIQLWLQQNKMRTGQTILTYWSDEKGREFEIADTSNIFFYHLNNRSNPTGVSVNDGRWHHLAFSFRLLCAEAKRIPGATYCRQKYGECDLDADCSGMEVTIMVDGQERATALLPVFLPSQQGIFLWGQRMLRRFKSAEVDLRDAYYQELRDAEQNLTSQIGEAFTDNQLLLMWNRRRSMYMNDTMLIEPSISKEAKMGPFTEGEPWRLPHFKYCELLAGGGFNPWTALSANMDEVRVYGYWRDPWAVRIGMNTVLNADSTFTFSEPFANYSLILYYSFDLSGGAFAHWSKDDFLRYPLNVADEAPDDNSPEDFPASMGGGTFQWAPLQVPSTAPLKGARTIQLTLLDSKTPIPIKLLDTASDTDTPRTGLYSRIEVTPKYGELMAGEDNCDEIETVTSAGIVYRAHGCRGSILGLRALGSLGKPTTGCAVGETITAADGHGSGALGVITQVSSTGSIALAEIEQPGYGYDWTLVHPTNLVSNSSTCLCDGVPTNTSGVMNACVEPLISAGQGVVSGAEFVGYDMGQPGATNGLPLNYKVTCAGGQCEGVKPRPCTHACFRREGWMTDVEVTVETFRKFNIGPYTEYATPGFDSVFWSNVNHMVWYVPSHLREYPFYIKDAEGVDILQDTIKDEFMVRKFDHHPPNELTIDPDNPPPFVHQWFQVVLEKLALPLNTSIIWEESAEMLIQLQLIDFDKGTAILNSPFAIYANPPRNGVGRLYQADRVTLSDAGANASDCICTAAPGFDDPATEATASRVCDKSKLGNYCMKRGKEITSRDTLVTSFLETLIIPGFQHARDGFFVVYSMGKFESGEASFTWQMRHPQGQVQNAHVNISVRTVNNPPVATGGSYTTQEDTMVEIILAGSDPDDTELPATYVTEFPKHGHLYQCLADSITSPCALGEGVSVTDEAATQLATVVVDATGAIDDEITPVYRFVDPLNVADPRVVPNKATSDTVLTAGYGVGSWTFDPDDNSNFKKLCGGRGTIAADLIVPFPVFVTGVEVMYDVRYDTPFRLLARKLRTYPDLSFDYNLDPASGEFKDVLSAQADMSQSGMTLGTETDPSFRFRDLGRYRASQKFFGHRVSCDTYTNGVSDCNQVWNEERWVRGEKRTYNTQDSDRWFELYRGLPHQSQLTSDRFSPIFPDTSFQTTQVRIEACGQEGRTFDGKVVNFLKSVEEVVIQGKRAARPKGFVRDLKRRLLYIPNHNFVGTDALKFAVRDHGFGAKRSPAIFSSRRYWSNTVTVDLTVSSRPDTPLGTAVVISQITSPTDQGVVFPLTGTHPGFDGTTPVTHFLVAVTEMPTRGMLFTDVARGVRAVPDVFVDFPDELGFTVEAFTCGKPFTQFRYRLKNVTYGDNIPTSEYIITMEIRCPTGQICDNELGMCTPCPAGTFGSFSGVDYTCEVCPPGMFQDQTGSLVCRACAPGTYNGLPGAQACRECPQGTFNDRSAQMRCVACAGGTYAPVPRMLQCLKCGAMAYTFTTGSVTCIDCPANTKATSETSLGLQACECVHGTYDVLGRVGRPCLRCPHGAYCHGRKLLPVARTGYWTSRELWTNDTFDEEYPNAFLTAGVAVFAPCSFRRVRGVCVGYPDVNVQEAEEVCQYKDSSITQGPRVLNPYTSEGIDVNVSECTLRGLNHSRGGLRAWDARQGYEANSYCADGYAGIVCAECAEGWYRGIVSYCTKCHPFYAFPFIGLAYFLFLAMMVVAFWAALFILSANKARSFYLIITHIQLSGVVGNARVPWPIVAQVPLNAFSLLNINLDALHWECIGMRWNPFFLRFYLDLLIPVGITAGFYGYYHLQVRQGYFDIEQASAQWKHRKAQRKKKREKLYDDSVTVGSKFSGLLSEDGTMETMSVRSEISDRSVVSGSDSSDDPAAPEVAVKRGGGGGKGEKKTAKKREWDRDMVMVSSHKGIHQLKDKGIWWVGLSLNLLFLAAAQAVFIPWSCTKVSPDLNYLDRWPAFSCDYGSFQAMFIASLVFGGAWLVVFPGAMAYILRQGWQNELVLDRIFARQFGFFFECYEVKWFAWELTALFRKLVFALAMVFVSSNGYIQLLVVGTYSCVHLGFTYYCMPHTSRIHNIVDMFLQAQLILVILFALTNIVDQTGLKIITTKYGPENESERIKILQSQPSMDEVSGLAIDANWVLNLCFLLVLGGTYGITLLLLFLDIYQGRPSAPSWAPYVYNAITGTPLFSWDEVMARLGVALDRHLAMMRDRYRTKPPERPASRWAHRVAEKQEHTHMEAFHTQESVEAILHAVVQATEEEEWAKDKESVLDYIYSLDKRIFASEMYNSKAPNLPILERERNLAKKRLMLYWHHEVADTFKALYEQTGRNEQTMWDMQELERVRQHHIITATAQEEHGKQLEREWQQQQRRVGNVDGWRTAHDKELAHCEDLEVKVKQARDAVTLYHLEESGSSEDERDIDDYLRSRIADHIENKTAQDLLKEGKMEALPKF